MKNRTVIGIICMVLAIAITFIVAPVVSKLTTDSVSVPVLKNDIGRGAKITSSDIELVNINSEAINSNVITDQTKIIGRYAASTLYKGDFVTDSKLTSSANTADDVIYSLNGSKFAMSFTIDSFAAGLSGKLQNGDIISLVVKDSNGKSIMPAAFKYVKVITTTTAGGVDQDKVVKNDDGTFDAPATVTLLVNETQATLLADYEQGTISCVLVYRGTAENAQKFLDTQDKYFGITVSKEETDDSSSDDSTENDKAISENNDTEDITNG